MRRNPESSRTARAGFTLIELLIVIGIIAVLVSLTAAAVMRVRYKAFELQIRNDISQLSTATQQFNVENNVDYFPSRIRLRNDGAYDIANANPLIAQYEKESYTFLKRVWPRLWTRGAVNWFPDSPGQPYYDLTGEQCLVFFLGGIQQNGTCLGFAVNVADPTVLTGSRKQLFDFPVARLLPVSNGNYAPLVFLDPLKERPYAYFSCYGTDNGYNRYWSLFGADSPSIAGGAYYDLPQSLATPPKTIFYNKGSFQIICAGIDKTFGPGGAWDARSGTPFQQGADGGYDDLSNFHDKIMGSGAQ